MSLLREKSKENIEVAEYCINTKQGYCHVAASRMYYAVFQKIKYLLQKQRFNYTAFLLKYNMQNPGRADSKPFSHGTIQYAISEHLESKADISEKEKLVDIDDLYRERRLSDYEEIKIKPDKARRNLVKAREIIAIIDKYDV